MARAPARIASYQENRFQPIMAVGSVGVVELRQHSLTHTTQTRVKTGKLVAVFFGAPKTATAKLTTKNTLPTIAATA